MKTFDYVLLGIVAVLALIGLFAPSQVDTPVVSESKLVDRVIEVLSEENLSGLVQVGEKVFTDGWSSEDKTGTETASLDTDGNLNIVGTVSGGYKTSPITATTTLTASQNGTHFLLSGTNGITTITLPAVTEAGTYFGFHVAGALATGNVVIDSLEGDNIEGSLIVAGAVVDCDAEDQINFVTDGENIGDYFEMVSTGSQWLLLDSGVLTSAKLTCTDPS